MTMRALSASELLEVRERGGSQTPVGRALLLLAAACPETSPEELAQLSVGQRDARLLKLRELTFGPRLHSLATCAACREQLELSFTSADLLFPSDESTEPLVLRIAPFEVRFRLPDSLDLAAISVGENRDAGAARQLLLERCLLSIERAGEQARIADLPPLVLEAIVERMAEADPQADVQIALTCPQCAARFQAPFDIESFFWNEISAWAERLLNEVHILASSYGWREADILNMSSWRRHFYLGLING
ncbi:MAG: hypothetical protein QOF02_3334 [Blastocatellia bacterium]|jgi:hypothetical protein|nr:hypothetical protein [Blastocatellia bacterium]